MVAATPCWVQGRTAFCSVDGAIVRHLLAVSQSLHKSHLFIICLRSQAVREMSRTRQSLHQV